MSIPLGKGKSTARGPGARTGAWYTPARERSPGNRSLNRWSTGVEMALSAAYGGAAWSPREASLREEMTATWGDWGVASECGRLRAVLLHRPGSELDEIEDF